jgi:hypothetical protein
MSGDKCGRVWKYVNLSSFLSFFVNISQFMRKAEFYVDEAEKMSQL